MADTNKRFKVCADGSKKDMISRLPESLIYEILGHLSTKDIVRTSVLSTKWRHYWQHVGGLDLDINEFPNSIVCASFAERFIYSHRESWITKLRLRMHPSFAQDHYYRNKFPIAPWIEAVSRIQYLDVDASYPVDDRMPLSIYTSATLVHLRLSYTTLANVDFVSLPCLKILHLENNKCPNGATIENLISGSPVLEDLMISSMFLFNSKVIQVRSQTVTTIYVDNFEVVIDAPLLKCFKTMIVLEKEFKILNLGFSTRLNIGVGCSHGTNSENLIRDILTDISKVKDLVINDVIWKDIFLYNEKSRPLLQFRHLSRLNAGFSKYDLEMLPTILESCPVLEYFILELVKSSRRHKNKDPPKAMFSSVPRCLVSSLKFMELKRSISMYEGEMELITYFLKNSRNLEKLKLNIYLTKKSECAFLKELLAVRRCSTVCEVLLF